MRGESCLPAFGHIYWKESYRMSLYFLLLVATFSPFLLWEDVMELANIALLSAEQTVSSPFQTCTLACSSTGQVIWSAGLASCDSEIHCMYNCLGRKKKQQSSVDGGIHTHTSLPHFPLNNIRTELHPTGPSAPRIFSLCHVSCSAQVSAAISLPPELLSPRAGLTRKLLHWQMAPCWN